eukprot:4116162-Pyramimonas_sp.AAC.2
MHAQSRCFGRGDGVTLDAVNLSDSEGKLWGKCVRNDVIWMGMDAMVTSCDVRTCSPVGAHVTFGKNTMHAQEIVAN